MKTSRKQKSTLLDRLMFIGFGLSGAAALIYEVVWTRSLSTTMGSSTYALSTMLAAFMGGLSLGGYLGGKLSAKVKQPEVAFACIELGIGLSGLLTISLINALTPLYIKSYFVFHLSFHSFSVIQFLINFLVMAFPTTFMGMTFPIVITYFSRQNRDIGPTSGSLYSMNTLGAIAGSIAAGFLLIPTFGIYGTTYIAAILNIITALIIVVCIKKKVLPMFVATFAALILSAVIDAPQNPYFSYYFANRFGSYEQARTEMAHVGSNIHDLTLFHKSDIEGDVYILKKPHARNDDENVLVNGSKLEAGNDRGFLLLPLLAYYGTSEHAPPEKVLNIGLGTGRTLGHLADLPLQTIDSVELNGAILEGNRQFICPELFSDPRIHHIQADGRNFLLLEKTIYDLIIVSPSWAVDVASGNLNTHEFFSIARERLAPEGVIALSTDFHLLTEEHADIMLRTFAQSFPYASAWRVDHFMMLVGKTTPFEKSENELIQAINAHKPDLNEIYTLYRSIEAIRGLPNGRINTDNHPVLEFITARNIITNESNAQKIRQ